MRSLLPALTLRQLGRLNSVQLLHNGHGQAWSAWCPRTLHARQLWGSAGPMAAKTQLPTLRDSASGWPVHHQIRFRSTKKKGRQTAQQEEESDDDEKSDYADELEEDSDLPKDFRDMEKAVPSFRYDLILKAGLDMARNKVEDAFYGNRLRINGLRLVKKSKTVKVGDTLDFIVAEDKDVDSVNLKRVIFKKVVGETRDADKYKVILRSWKSLNLPKKDVFKE